MATRDVLDALSIVEAAQQGIDQTLRAAEDQCGGPDPMLLDVELVERHRDDLRRGLDYLAESHGGPRRSDEEHAELRRRRYGQLPGGSRSD